MKLIPSLRRRIERLEKRLADPECDPESRSAAETNLAALRERYEAAVIAEAVRNHRW